MTREKAIEVVKEAMPTLWKDTKEAIETLIPELRENEDEKIRKKAIEYIDAFVPYDDKEEIIAYLEKQKEQKKGTKSIVRNVGGSLAEILVDTDTDEQKPAEWSEEDYEALDMCLAAIPKGWKTKSGILLTKWLKSKIHTQPKQEWSGEDTTNITDNKKFFLWIYNRLLYVYKEDPDIDYMCSFRKRIDQLFSKPHWKPTEETI